MRLECFERAHRLADRAVAQEAGDEEHGQPVPIPGVGRGRAEPFDDVAHQNAAVDVRLRVEEQLDVPDAVLMSALEVGVGQVGEVVRRPEDLHARVVEVEERLQVGELVGGGECRGVGERQLDAVALSERERQFGLERAFHVHVQLRLGQRPDEVGHHLSVRLAAPRIRPTVLSQRAVGP